MALKSLVGRSLRWMRNSGGRVLGSLPVVLSMVSTISRMFDSVFWPEEQPRSAMPRLFGVVEM